MPITPVAHEMPQLQLQRSSLLTTGAWKARRTSSGSDACLQVPAKAKHYGLSAKLPQPLVPAKGVVLQFELKLAEGLTCGGAYLKYLTSGEFETSGLKDDTPYTIMFGPDKCGSTNKVRCLCMAE